jgi:hypothetical protein
MSASEETKGVELGEQTCWVINGLSDYQVFFRNLGCLLPTSGALIYLESTGISPDVRQYLEQHSVSPMQKVNRGTLWPKPSTFHIPVSPEVLMRLADFASCHAYPEIADHCHVYTNDGMILQWYDACDPGCPLGVGPTISEENVKTFCKLAHATYKPFKNGR